jgi:hypothetical protein
MTIWNNGVNRSRTHTIPININIGENSRVRWSFYPVDTAILFVHGFASGATKAWQRFPDLLPENLDYANTDIIFLGYESIYRTAESNASLLFDAIDTLSRRPTSLFEESVGPNLCYRTLDIRYKSILLVCHSLGAIIGRLALLEAWRREVEWLDRVKMIYFAPAHMGIYSLPLIGPIKRAMTIWGMFKRGAGRSNVSILEDLSKDSPFIVKLQEDVKKYNKITKKLIPNTAKSRTCP